MLWKFGDVDLINSGLLNLRTDQESGSLLGAFPLHLSCSRTSGLVVVHGKQNHQMWKRSEQQLKQPCFLQQWLLWQTLLLT